MGSIPIRVVFALSVSEREPLAALSETETSDFGFLPNYHKEGFLMIKEIRNEFPLEK